MGNRAADDDGDRGKVDAGGEEWKGGVKKKMGGGEEKLSYPNSSLIFRG